MRIDIKSESEIESERAAAEQGRAALGGFPGVTAEVLGALEAAGLGSPEAVAATDLERLREVQGLGDGAGELQAAAQAWMAAREQAETAPDEPPAVEAERPPGAA